MNRRGHGLKPIAIFSLLAIFLITGGLFFVYERSVATDPALSDKSNSTAGQSPNLLTDEKITDQLDRLRISVKSVSRLISKPKVVAPTEPLRQAESESDLGAITSEGIILWTNIERDNWKLPALTANNTLNLAAASKLEDMFSRQYFAHISPNGEGIGEVAGRFNYQYAVIAENLALGNFVNEAELIKAWMESPGHRANILNNSFTQIGAAARVGQYQNRLTILAVQVFTKPRPVCALPNADREGQIIQNEVKIKTLYDKIKLEKDRIENTDYRSDKERQKDIADYNILVGDYNDLIKVTEATIAAYNKEVDDYNRCVS